MSGSASFSSSLAQPSPFTVSQWHELEHQALIFKYLKAGLPVPPDLLVPIRRSFQLMSSNLLQHPNMGYCSYYGKKIDPEPGRCRRTDGKKWRCSKDAHPDSKYCERHMNRSRYRSRKPVESQSVSQSVSTVTLDIATGSSNGSRSFQNPCLLSMGNREGLCFPSTVSHSQIGLTPYGITTKDYRCLQGLKPEADNDMLPIAAGTVRSLEINPSMDSVWHLSTSQSPSNPLPDQRNGVFLQNSCPQMQMLQDFDPLSTHTASKQQQQHYFFGREFGSPRSVKQEHQSLQPLSDELPKTIDFGYYLNDQRADKSSLSTTQLSMSIPMAPTEFFARGMHSSKDASADKYLS
ncbi:hypothetical protein ACOSP7_003253 [Xanthoceras sorbifolium]|uniref:Growth-regulating factor n=1 Tax=Xanthoceras sorbifolium TaxID=99658 RepID=A0ABQ8IJV7_9ROSI|nr:hypothetical protein JRO89_XS01G0067500 [Xanthoceras sorbifolium]